VWAPIWASFVQETDEFHTHFSFFNNWQPKNTYSVDVRLFDADGRQRSLVRNALTLGHNETKVLSIADFLNAEGIPTPFLGMLEARLVTPAGQDQVPGPGMLQADTIWTTSRGVTQSNNQSLGHANSPRGPQHFLSPKRTKMFGRIVANDRHDTMLSLMNLSSETGYATTSDTEIAVCDASGKRRQTRKITLPPHGSIWMSFNELFPNLPEFLDESRGVSSVVVIDKTVKLIGYLGLRDRTHGTIGMDHLFGG
jgi:hypothetical protein